LTKLAAAPVVCVTDAPFGRGRRAPRQLAARTRMTSRPSSTSSAVTPIVSERC
jgi:hypothetical protein